MHTLVLGSGLGFAIGLVLGLLGGGGSILTVPALVYVIGQTPQVAVTASLVIVGANSALGAFFHRAQGTLNWKIALIFGGSGMLASYLAAGLSKLFAPTLLLILFALLMLGVGALMIFRRSSENTEHAMRAWPAIVASGIVIGILTGLLGVGGGFLIVPALVMLVGLPMQQAVGTSLVIIAMNSLAGLLGHLSSTTIDVNLMALFIATGLVGTFVGARAAKRIRADQLRRLFAVFIIVLAVFLLYDNVGKLL